MVTRMFISPAFAQSLRYLVDGHRETQQKCDENAVSKNLQLLILDPLHVTQWLNA